MTKAAINGTNSATFLCSFLEKEKASFEGRPSKVSERITSFRVPIY